MISLRSNTVLAETPNMGEAIGGCKTSLSSSGAGPKLLTAKRRRASAPRCISFIVAFASGHPLQHEGTDDAIENTVGKRPGIDRSHSQPQILVAAVCTWHGDIQLDDGMPGILPPQPSGTASRIRNLGAGRQPEASLCGQL